MVKGFKEWAVVCKALEEGRQSVILRKGGIAEGREGFRFENRCFHLLPTRYHEQVSRTVLPSGTPLPLAPEGVIPVSCRCEVVESGLVADPGRLDELSEFHILSRETVEQRVHYDEPCGVRVALVRAYRLEPVWELADSPSYGGCRSWVELPDPPAGHETPAWEDAAFEELAGRVRRAAGWAQP